MEPNQSDLSAKKQSAKAQHIRKRKKQYFNRIRQQMEFYFGDANLSKDRFLNKLLAVNPYVPLDVFLSFNKIKELANGIEEIQKAVESSEMLELSSDRQSVRRLTEIRKKDNLDEYMVYVEALPPRATHETVRQQFKQFGNIAYVSLPKYRTSGRIKEFAFVEYEEKSSVEKCINAFRQFNGVIGDSQDPENLKSVIAYVKEQEDLENQEENQADEEGKEEEGKEENQDDNIAENKKKHDDDGDNTNETKTETEGNDKGESSTSEGQPKGIAPKRAKEDPTISDSEDVPHPKRLKTESETDQDKEGQGNTTDEKASLTDENRDQQLKKRRRRKQNLPQPVTNNDNSLVGIIPDPINLVDDVKNGDDPNQSLTSLRVCQKTEWKRLRNIYLTLQRQKYSEVKKLLRQNKHGDNRKVSTLPLANVRPVTMKSKKFASPPPPKRICTRNINFYGARDEQNANTYECSIIDENKTNSDKTTESENNDKKKFAKDLQFEFEPGLIVKVNFEAPCTDIVDFKGEMKQYPFVQYTDIKEGQSFAFVRVDAPRSAPVLIKHCAPNRCQILTGEIETQYWAKIAKDREQKLSKAVKVPKNRSRKMRNIIRNIAEVNVTKSDNKTTVTHIRFED